MPGTRHVTLASETDLQGFRSACRALVAGRTPPEAVTWQVASPDGPHPHPHGPARVDGVVAKLLVPRAFVDICGRAILHRDPGRLALLYRLLWRLQHDPRARDMEDADWQAARRCSDEVARAIERMQSSLRFETVPIAAPAGAPLAPSWHVAWYEPEHRIVEPVATFFAERFPSMRWGLLTPDGCARWDGEHLRYARGVSLEGDPDPAKLAATWQRVAAAFEAGESGVSAKPVPDPARPRPRVTEAATQPNQPDPTLEEPTSLEDLAQALDRCRECPLGELATQGVPGEGPRRARLMFVGEQPGDQEDLKGRPFVGPAGQLLDRAFRELGWPRDKVYVTNAVKHFKFELRGKRRIHKTPAQQEMAACLHWLESEIALVRPEALVALGATAARQLMGTAVPVMRERGHWLKRRDGLRVLITLHPSALLRADPEDRDAAYAAWLADLRAAAGYFAQRGAA
ncbi:MAG TPA: UdgX family uracil-DNA binding protein [Caldimonas sp.]|nr:UdgX family uracil-DNA binding protein [Caldimonas sp.]